MQVDDAFVLTQAGASLNRIPISPTTRDRLIGLLKSITQEVTPATRTLAAKVGIVDPRLHVEYDALCILAATMLYSGTMEKNVVVRSLLQAIVGIGCVYSDQAMGRIRLCLQRTSEGSRDNIAVFLRLSQSNMKSLGQYTGPPPDALVSKPGDIEATRRIGYEAHRNTKMDVAMRYGLNKTGGGGGGGGGGIMFFKSVLDVFLVSENAKVDSSVLFRSVKEWCMHNIPPHFEKHQARLLDKECRRYPTEHEETEFGGLDNFMRVRDVIDIAVSRPREYAKKTKPKFAPSSANIDIYELEEMCFIRGINRKAIFDAS